MKKKTFIIFLVISVFFFSKCTSTENTPKDVKTKKEEVTNLESLAKRHVEARLNIPFDEKYTMSIHRKHLDNDTILDAIILVNRLDYALNEIATNGKNTAKVADLGFTGNYNFLFYYDGALNKISPEIPVPSGAYALLKLNFNSFSGNDFSDFTIDYTIRNSQFRNYYIVINHTPVRVFQWKIYDYLNEDKEEAFYFEFDKGSFSNVKDILIYKGNLKNSSKVEDIYNFDPIIEKADNELIHRFFFLDEQFKYFTNK